MTLFQIKAHSRLRACLLLKRQKTGMVMNSYVGLGLGVQLAAAFRVPCTAQGANFHVSSHPAGWAGASGEPWRLSLSSLALRSWEWKQLSTQGHLAGKGLPLSPPPHKGKPSSPEVSSAGHGQAGVRPRCGALAVTC